MINFLSNTNNLILINLEFLKFRIYMSQYVQYDKYKTL